MLCGDKKFVCCYSQAEYTNIHTSDTECTKIVTLKQMVYVCVCVCVYIYIYIYIYIVATVIQNSLDIFA
jgi:hypothetical protein